MASVTSNCTANSILISGNTSKSSNITWSLPTIPDGATITSCVLSGTLRISMIMGTGTVTINGTTYTAGSFSIDLGTTNTRTSVPVNATGNATGENNYVFGIVSFSNVIYTVTYELNETTEVSVPIYFNNILLDKILIGTTDIVKGYLGSEVLFDTNNKE